MNYSSAFGDRVNKTISDKRLKMSADKTILNVDYFRVGFDVYKLDRNHELQEQILEWLKNNVKGPFFGCRTKSRQNTVYFRFKEKSEAAMFKLRFSGID